LARERELSEVVAGSTSRRGLLAKLGGALLGVTGGGALSRAREARATELYHFCGHIYTTASCPHPSGLPRIDAHGYPLRAGDGHPIDDLGRTIDASGRPVDGEGRLLRDPLGEALPAAPRTLVCSVAGERYGFEPYIDGSWHRCCNGFVRKLVDCCGYVENRINGDAALTGYCYSGRKVFCVTYFDTRIKC